jgi:hypothetical protein
MSRESTVGIATGYGLKGRLVEVRFFSSSRRPDLFWGPPNLHSNRYRDLFPREADQSHPNSAEIKNSWICASTPPYAFMA